jgi:hypothetical protein
MHTIIFYTFIASLIGTVLTLGIGLGGFFLGGAFNKKHGNKMMQTRVMFQGLTIILFTLLLMTGQN